MIVIFSDTFATLAIDVAKSIEHTLENEITESPIEDGANKTDHVVPKQDAVTYECVISDSPIGSLSGQGFRGRSAEAYSRLRQLRASREPVTVVDNLLRLDNMVLERLTVPRDERTGRAIRFTAAFKQIEIATTVRAAKKVSDPRAAIKVDRGAIASPEGPALDSISSATTSVSASQPQRQIPAAFSGDSRSTMRSEWLKSHPNGIVGPVGPF